jgi:hypothetical protein
MLNGSEDLWHPLGVTELRRLIKSSLSARSRPPIKSLMTLMSLTSSGIRKIKTTER